jgi:hypothetical protein
MPSSRIYSVTIALVMLFGLGTTTVGLAQAQNVKTVKLPNGEEVVDISGEWDTQIENYGPWSGYGTYPNVIKITLEGNSFVGIRMKADTYSSAGTELFRGELDNDGIKKIQIITGMGPYDAKGQISENGNKIIIDDGEKARSTLIRK